MQIQRLWIRVGWTKQAIYVDKRVERHYVRGRKSILNFAQLLTADMPLSAFPFVQLYPRKEIPRIYTCLHSLHDESVYKTSSRRLLAVFRVVVSISFASIGWPWSERRKCWVSTYSGVRRYFWWSFLVRFWHMLRWSWDFNAERRECNEINWPRLRKGCLVLLLRIWCCDY